VGGRIVGEIILGLPRADADSHLTADPSWPPSLLSAGPEFGLAGLLVLATPD
jgi:hypothetical protein